MTKLAGVGGETGGGKEGDGDDRLANADNFGGRPPSGGYPLADAPNQPWLHRLFQFLGGPESDLLAGLDFDGLAGPRISSHPCGTILDL